MHRMTIAMFVSIFPDKLRDPGQPSQLPETYLNVAR
jgi:hypothetical protein